MPPVPSPELGYILILLGFAIACFIIANLLARMAGYKE